MGSRLEQNSSAVRKRIEQHTFADEGGEEYSASSFGGFTDYMRRKKIKLQNRDAETRAQSASEKPQIFRGVVAHVNGYTQPSLNDLHTLVVQHGGGFLQYLDGKTMVTHIVASNLTPKKREEFKRYRIVKPAWIVDSVAAGKILPWDSYRVVDDGSKQRLLGFQDGKIVSQASTQDQRRYREQTETSWYSGQVKQKAGDLNQKQPARQEEVDRNHGAFTDLASRDPATVTSRIRSPVPLHSGGDNEVDTPVVGTEQHLVDPSQFRQDGVSADRGTMLPPEHDDTNSHSPRHELAEGPEDKPLTAEEHNALLLADPKVWKSTVVNPGFLKQYYEESRLHHLSTWKADLKAQLQALAQEKSSSQKARMQRPKGSRRYILHVDFDSFFVAVSLLEHPKYRETPAVVAHGGGSGSEIASCNYPARKFGVKNGMWMKTAQELCPGLKVLPYDFKAYEDASRQFYEAIMHVGGIVQSVSVDEALLDASNICIEAGGHDGRGNSEGSIFREQEMADRLAKQIRDEVLEKTKCAVSVGIGGNILQAKLALRKAKPAGQFQLKPDDVLNFIGSLTVQDLPGVAYSIGNKLEEIGIRFVKDIRETTKERLVSTLGPKTGEKLWEYSRGIDRVEVGEQVVRKSVSAEVNWGIRFATHEQAEEFVRSICGELEKRLLNEAVKGRQFSLKIMRRAKDAPLDPPKHLGHGKCDVFNKSVVLGVATNDKAVISREALSILRGYGFPPGELRGIGVQMTKLEPLRGRGTVTESSQRLISFAKANTDGSKQPPDFRSKVIGREEISDTPEQRATPLSVRRLLFKTFRESSEAKLVEEQVPTPSRAPILHGEDILDSPHKPKLSRQAEHPGSIGKDDKVAGLLNTTGTQFILPTQVDPEALAALPEDIRARFKAATESAQQKSLVKEPVSPRASESPARPDSVVLGESQLDPETLAALPDDIRAEVLAQFSRAPSPRPNRQVLLPQSPRKTRTLKSPAKKVAAPVKRIGLASRGRGSRGGSVASVPTLTQANFVAVKAPTDDGESTEEEATADFLAALPDDIRSEVLEQQRRERLRRRGGLDVVRTRKTAVLVEDAAKRTIEVPPRELPTFTSQRLSSLPQLREAMSLWYNDFRDEEPAREDVDALAVYLRQVVLEEQDMTKAVAIVKWLIWLIDSGASSTKSRWAAAIESLKTEVQAAVLERGLGRVQF